ncbi:P-loop ATPase, Sll1717 family [Pantoea sp. NGS-ED-1003]|uniref:P-loop ATPase, Sll1717 family n=1 Tax=Pantoea sp. NGS-ED-1003 TaxID=1526743 RepID=UPI0005348D59|nr:hypothetical protein [Pantoea sp. NGS-ED-1003]
MKGNSLGDIRAESDTNMLEKAFWETADYKSILESSDRCIIVGRRGTGKSALVHMLSKKWKAKPKTAVITIAPEEEQIIGLRDVFSIFGTNYSQIKAGIKLSWRYALYMEVITEIANHYKLKNDLDVLSIQSHIQGWGARRQAIATKIRKKLNTIIDKNKTPASLIADLSDIFEFDLLEEVILEALEKSDYQMIILADRLDEGYSPDDLGVAIVDGFAQTVIDLKARTKERIISYAFIRDNIYRSISKMDPDFTRNIEGQTLRLHWDEYNLFNVVCNRLRVAFDVQKENNLKTWNQFAARELKGMEGFRTALKLTLYRPRDILVLLNDAFLRAGSNDRNTIILDDIDSTAKSISINRLNDLHKEYDTIFPALEEFTRKFNGHDPEMSLGSASIILKEVLDNDDLPRDKLQDILLFDGPIQVIQRLYSVGFIGLYNDQTSSFVFCHDGKDPDRDFKHESRILIHPCYWLALGLSRSEIKLSEAEDIHDEYDIEVSSISTEQRKQKIGALLSELNSIDSGVAGAHDFESWCLKTLRILFAGDLHNIELHSNKNGIQQRDIIATNSGERSVWKRIIEDYQSRMVIFEIKNYVELRQADYRQVNSYLSNEYGKIAFIITRDHKNELDKHKELAWAQEIYHTHKKLIIKLSYKFIEKHLSKARNPQKHDAINTEVNKLLDTYIRQYLQIKSR